MFACGFIRESACQINDVFYTCVFIHFVQTWFFHFTFDIDEPSIFSIFFIFSFKCLKPFQQVVMIHFVNDYFVVNLFVVFIGHIINEDGPTNGNDEQTVFTNQLVQLSSNPFRRNSADEWYYVIHPSRLYHSEDESVCKIAKLKKVAGHFCATIKIRSLSVSEKGFSTEKSL